MFLSHFKFSSRAIVAAPGVHTGCAYMAAIRGGAQSGNGDSMSVDGNSMDQDTVPGEPPTGGGSTRNVFEGMAANTCSWFMAE